MRKPPPADGIRVASIPAAHPYVRGLGLQRAGISVLDDPPVPGSPAGQWWPPVMLDPAWIGEHRDAFDVMHLHFGSESLSLDELASVCAALRDARRPLVYTVHDLDHPQLEDQSRHVAQVQLLCAEADALLTLTSGAARAVTSLSGRRVTVVAHPAVLEGAPPRVAADGPPVIGVHLRDLRPGVDGPGTVNNLIVALDRLRQGGVRADGAVWMHDRTRDEAARDAVRRSCAAGGLSLVEAPRPDDETLHAQLASLAISVLPYRHGTHSGWLELCWDLGVPVATPVFGHFVEQHPETVAGFASGDADGLAAAFARLLMRPDAIAGSSSRQRQQEAHRRARERVRADLVATHAAIYREVLGR